MFTYIRIAQEIASLVKLANQLSDAAPGDTPKYGFLFTNRSFLVPAIGILINILILFGFPPLVPVVELLQLYSPDIIAEHIILAITVVTAIWSYIERRMTSAKVIVTRDQATAAVRKMTEIAGNDALSQALKHATH
jgi:hypothetical protein